MSKRTDLAAPDVIDPAAFTFVAGTYFGGIPDDEEFNEYLGEWVEEKLPEGVFYTKRKHVLEVFPMLNASGNFARKGTCDHCGAKFDWGAVYQHTSGAHIVVGNVCADGTLSVPDKATLAVKRLKSKLQAQRTLFKNTITACEQAIAKDFVWLYAEREHTNPTLADIRAKGLHWGGLTDGQIGLINKIRYGVKAQWQIDKEAREAARAAEEAAAKDVPLTDERIKVTGEVVTTREQDGYMGGTVLKMLVKTTEGFKLWGSVPDSLEYPNGTYIGEQFGRGDKLRGATVEFYCKVSRSDNDSKFGFFNRPTKAKVIKNAA